MSLSITVKLGSSNDRYKYIGWKIIKMQKRFYERHIRIFRLQYCELYDKYLILGMKNVLIFYSNKNCGKCFKRIPKRYMCTYIYCIIYKYVAT